ncbi:complement decay-accelerating factor-like [Chanodichthys erythropterus]|uniref:complement decay-accelerating factor-like n=1 Tax=Chanodichthys erythropterus TaxID=933992 RepID=UPI00351ED134
MIGDYHIVCSPQGWKPDPPKCIGPCSLPVFGGYVTLTEEFRSQKSFPHGSKVTFDCIRGHKPVDSTVSKSVTCEETKWTELLLTCKVEKCQVPPVIENGQIEAVSYKCHDGFFLTGSSKLYCSEDGTFDPPKCLDGCPTPEIPHAIRIGGKSPPYKLANSIEYKCEPGYIMRGEGHIVCTAKGWSPEPPQCIVVKCKTPPTIENGQLDEDPQDSYDYSQVVSYK